MTLHIIGEETPAGLKASEAKEAKKRRRESRKRSLDALNETLNNLVLALDVAVALESGDESKTGYFQSYDLGKFQRLLLEKTGKDLEQALFNLHLIEETDCGLFMDERVRRRRA